MTVPMLFLAASAMAAGAGGMPGAATDRPVDLQAACQALRTVEVSKSQIALPTNGAVVVNATFVPATVAGAMSYCSVDGEIRPVSPQGKPIKFNVALPSSWNGKAVHLMGGGWDGVVVKGSGPIVGGENLPAPVHRGYAGFGSNSGHDYGDPDWQLDQEALENFAGDQLRKTRDVAVALMKLRYGSAPRATYSAGGSGGGREALYVADRWPELYQGVIAFYPVWSAVGAFSGWIANAKALAVPGAWSRPEQQIAIGRKVASQCDRLDGLEDGLVANVRACHVDPASLRCPDQAAASDDCLSDQQIKGLVAAYGTARKLAFPLPNGVDRYEAYNVLNAGAQPRMGKSAPGGPITAETRFGGPRETAFGAALADPFVRLAVLRDPNGSLFTFDANQTAAVHQRIAYLSRRMDVDPTLKRFVARGGKVILVHGNVDQVHSADWSDQFQRRFVAAHGAGSRAHLRYFRIAGYGHGLGLRDGASFDFQADLLSALDEWALRGTAPANLVAIDDTPRRNHRARPMCEAPMFARYNGAGDVNLASSFHCSAR